MEVVVSDPDMMLTFFVDEEQKKERAKKRKVQRQRMGYSTKRRKLMKPADLAFGLMEGSWEQYLRIILISAYRQVQTFPAGASRDGLLRAILACCPLVPPVDCFVSAANLENRKVEKVLEEADLETICDLWRFGKAGERLEPALTVKASQMLESLRKFFPRGSRDLADTPYCDDDQLCDQQTLEEIEAVAEKFKQAAKHGHVGAQLSLVSN